MLYSCSSCVLIAGKVSPQWWWNFFLHFKQTINKWLLFRIHCIRMYASQNYYWRDLEKNHKIILKLAGPCWTLLLPTLATSFLGKQRKLKWWPYRQNYMAYTVQVHRWQNMDGLCLFDKTKYFQSTVVSKQDYNKLTVMWLNFKINIHGCSD